jgi:cbb3-type cytochrome oxidase maturation protein
VSVLAIVLAVAFVIVAAAVAAFAWAARQGQFDDLSTPAVRMLFEDDRPPPEREEPAP